MKHIIITIERMSYSELQHIEIHQKTDETLIQMLNRIIELIADFTVNDKHRTRWQITNIENTE